MATPNSWAKAMALTAMSMSSVRAPRTGAAPSSGGTERVRMGVAMTVVALLAVVLSIPYWRALGLVGGSF